MTARVPLLMGIGLLFLAIVATGALLGRQAGRAGPREVDSASAARSLAARLPSGQVATAVNVGRVESVGGGIRPGDTVDVYAFFADRLAGGVASTRVLLREKLVYAVNQSADALSLTLAMPPDEASLFQGAMQMGARPYAVVRSARGMTAAAAPLVFDDDGLASWIARVAEGR